jgi:hypothetical protein
MTKSELRTGLIELGKKIYNSDNIKQRRKQFFKNQIKESV